MQIKQSFLDKTISYFSPERGAKRIARKAQIQALTDTDGYDVAGSKRRYMRTANSSASSHDADYLEKRNNITGMCREATTNISLALAIIKRHANMTVNTGLKLQSTPDFEYLGIDEETSSKWAMNVEREFRYYAESKECDITRHNNFYELQFLTFYSILLSGDISVTYPYKETPNFKHATKIKLIEADLLSNPEFQPELNQFILDGTLAGGIKQNKDGSPKTYYFSNNYPDDNIGYSALNTWTPIDALDADGFQQVFHLFFKTRPGQRRGTPLLAEHINLLRKIVKLSDAELTAHVVASFFTVFVKDQKGYNAGMGEGFAPSNSAKDKKDNPDDAYQYEMGSGNVLELDDDKDVQIAESRKMQEGFTEFFKTYVRELASGVDLPYSQLMLHFDANYSASRAELQESYKAMKVKRAYIANSFCQVTYVKWLDEQVAKGRIFAPGYFEDSSIKSAWCKSLWHGMGMGQIDPLKETKSSLLAVHGGLSSLEKEYNKVNDDGDWNSTIETQARNTKKIETLGIKINTTSLDATLTKEVEEDDEESE